MRHSSKAFTLVEALVALGKPEKARARLVRAYQSGAHGYRAAETADDWAALFACLIILFNGGRIFRAALNEIMDAAPPDPLQQEIRKLSSAVPGVVRIEKCRARKSGLGLFVEIHVEVDGDLTVRRGHEIAHEVTDHLKSSSLAIQHVVVHVEPAPGRETPVPPREPMAGSRSAPGVSPG